MGIDYSSSIGYGIAFPEPESLGFFKQFESIHEDGGIPEWLEENGFERVGYDCCGNWMSGPHVMFFYLKGTEMLHMEHGYGDDIYDFGAPVDMDGNALLARLANLIGYEGNIGWKLINNVS